MPATITNEFEKRTSEQYARAFNWYNRLSRWAFGTNLPSPLTILSGTVSAKKESDSTDATSLVLQTTVLGIDDTFSVYSVKGGVDGVNYIITLLVNTSDGGVLEENIRMKVVNA